MRKILTALIAGAILLGAMAPNAIARPATPDQIEQLGEALAALDTTIQKAENIEKKRWRYQECRFQSLENRVWSPREEYLTAKCAVSKWDVSGGLSKFIQVGDCESGWYRWANNSDNYLGLFQHQASSYTNRISSFEPNTWDFHLSTWWPNSRGQIVMTARMVHAVGWGPWPCA